MLTFDLQKRFGTFALDVSLTVENEIMVLLAPSGGGKTLTLNLVSGIVSPDSGNIQINGTVVFDKSRNIAIPIRKRGIGYIFQDYALFPNKTVRENIAFGMPGRDRSNDSLTALLKRFDLEEKAQAYPNQLSGGQKQRVAIARALAAKSRVLLFDEPLSAIDVQLRESLLIEISKLPGQYSLPVLYVTHNFREAEFLADRIAVMNEGKIIEIGGCNTIFLKPNSLFTAQFLGAKNLFPCSIKIHSENTWSIRIFEKILLKIDPSNDFKNGDAAWLGIHPKDVRLVVTNEERPNTLKARVTSMRIIDRIYRIALQPLYPAEPAANPAGTGSDAAQQVNEGLYEPAPGFLLSMDIEELTCRKYKIRLDDIIRVSLKPDRMFLCR